MIHPREIVLIIHNTALWIHQYQLTQEREDRIILRVVPSIIPTPEELARLEESVTKLLGLGVEFQAILVPQIELESSGKFRVSRSLVKSAYNEIDWGNPQTS
ncbi:MAG: hypothetical protein ACREOW_13955 [Thermodesulfobacteriota bacterium]